MLKESHRIGRRYFFMALKYRCNLNAETRKKFLLITKNKIHLKWMKTYEEAHMREETNKQGKMLICPRNGEGHGQETGNTQRMLQSETTLLAKLDSITVARIGEIMKQEEVS